MNADDGMIFLGGLVVLCLILAFGAWWSDKWLEKRRPNVPPPQRRAVVGQSHKPWM